MDTKELFPMRLRIALKINGMRPATLADNTGIPKASISQYMNKISFPNQERIVILAEELNVRPSWLMGYDTEMEPFEKISDEKERMLKMFDALDDRRKNDILNIMMLFVTEGQHENEEK